MAVMPLVGQGEILPAKELPSLSTIYMLDAVIAKVQVALDDCFTKSMVSIILLQGYHSKSTVACLNHSPNSTDLLNTVFWTSLKSIVGKKYFHPNVTFLSRVLKMTLNK